MKSTFRVASLSLVLGAVHLCLAVGLWAQSANVPPTASDGSNRSASIAGNTGCGYSTGELPAAPVRPQRRSGQTEGKSGQASLVMISSNGPDEDSPEDSIVGLWHLIYTATSASGPFPPTPFQFVASFKTWHADGTEFENAFVPPTGGNICYGVWKELDHGSVNLHHIGLMFDSMGNVSNIFTVDERDRVASNGKTYSGTFDFKLWPPSFDAVGIGSPLAEVTGTTAGTRITVD